MIRVEIDETIAAPIEDVFARLADIRRYPEWMPKKGLFVTCTQDSEGPVGVGTPYTEKTRFGTLHGEVVSFDRPKEIGFRYAFRLGRRLVMEGRPGYTLQPTAEGGTRVHHVAEGRLYGPFELLEPIVQLVARGERRRTVDALKRSLEPPSSPAPAPAPAAPAT